MYAKKSHMGGRLAALAAIVSFAGLWGLGGCSDDDDGADAPGDEGVADEGLADEDYATPPELETLEEKLLALEACEPTHSHNSNFIDRGCDEGRAFSSKLREHRDTDDAKMLGLARQHLEHDSPSIRVGSARLVEEPFGVRDGGVEPVFQVAQREDDTRALASFMWILIDAADEHEEVGEWFLEDIAGHDEAELRRLAASLLGGLPGVLPVDGAVSTLLELAAEDPDTEVRAAACRYAGNQDDPDAIEVMAELTASPDAEPDIYRGCMTGLTGMWSGMLGAERFETAYDIAVKRMRASDEWRDWPLVTGALMEIDAEDFEEHPWLDKDVIIELLAKVVGDVSVAFTTRESAVEALVDLDAPAEVFAEIEAHYEDAEGEDRVAEAIAEATQGAQD